MPSLGCKGFVIFVPRKTIECSMEQSLKDLNVLLICYARFR